MLPLDVSHLSQSLPVLTDAAGIAGTALSGLLDVSLHAPSRLVAPAAGLSASGAALAVALGRRGGLPSLAISWGRRPRRGPRQWLVDDLLPCGVTLRHFLWPLIPDQKMGYLSIVGGAGGTGKSYLLIDLAVACVTGQDWLGMPPRRLSSIVYVDLEMDEQEFTTRLQAVCAGRGVAYGPVRRRLHYVPLKAMGLDLAVPSPDQQAKGEKAVGQRHVRKVVRRHRGQLILVDSLSYGANVAPGDQPAWRRLMLPPQGLEGIGPPVLAIDHVTVSQGKVKLAGGQNKQWYARSIFLLEKTKGGRVQLTHAKANFGDLLEPFTYTPTFEKGEGGATARVTFTRDDDGEGAGLRPRETRESRPGNPTLPTVPTLPVPIPLPSLPIPPSEKGEATASAGDGDEPRLEGSRCRERERARETQPGMGAGGGVDAHERCMRAILAILEREGPAVDVPLATLATELGLSRKTVANRSGELQQAGRAASRKRGTLTLPLLKKEQEEDTA